MILVAYYFFDSICYGFTLIYCALTVVSNDIILGVTGEDAEANGPGAEETPQQLEWTPDDVF